MGCSSRRDVYDLHHAILGLLFSVLITGVITDALKDAVGRPRPDFYWRCFPDGKELYDPVTGNVICHGERSLLKDGHKSFPSGHTSWSFAGLGFLALYLSGKIKAFDQRGHVAKLCIVFLPLLVACLIGISRVDDYRHHWQDVFAGGLLGWVPYAYFQMMESSRANPTNAVNQQPEGSNNNELPGEHHNRTEPNDLESGRILDLSGVIRDAGLVLASRMKAQVVPEVGSLVEMPQPTLEVPVILIHLKVEAPDSIEAPTPTPVETPAPTPTSAEVMTPIEVIFLKDDAIVISTKAPKMDV
ncbi:putative lipid phosphate phosphatase 3, chloroplastic [Cocos nucifera]|nr:putative lipid phosphate phosphatase 3, chloroplastic [Cocos nucifera]